MLVYQMVKYLKMEIISSMPICCVLTGHIAKHWAVTNAKKVSL